MPNQQRPRPRGQRRTRKPPGTGPHDRIVLGSVGRPANEGSLLPAILDRAREFQPHRAVRLQRHEPDLTRREHWRHECRIDRRGAGGTGSKVQRDQAEGAHVQDEEGVGIHPGHRYGRLDLARTFAVRRDRPLPLSIGSEHDDFGQAPVRDGDRSVGTHGDAGRPDEHLGFIKASGTPDLGPGEFRGPGPDAGVRYGLTIGVGEFAKSGFG